jgi:site-specific DNA-methyltransferase (adenine-specific)
MEYKVDYKGYEFIITQNEDGSFNIPDEIRDIEPFGTALKPASEYIVLARKPLSEKSVAENVLKWGTGGINVDGCRVGTDDTYNYKNGPQGNSFSVGKEPDGKRTEPVEMNSEGRFPANIILECICDEVIKGEKGEKTTIQTNISNKEANWFRNAGGDKGDTHTNPNCPCYLLDEQSGLVNQGHWPKGSTKGFGDFGGGSSSYEGVGTKDKTKSGASRFFYQAKVSKAERNMGLDGFEDKILKSNQINVEKITGREVTNPKESIVKNNHPTVKPVNLMTYLCRLITPQGGIVLDPFVGSGSTGIAARLEGFDFIGMEMDSDYFKIAEARIENFEKYRKFIK